MGGWRGFRSPFARYQTQSLQDNVVSAAAKGGGGDTGPTGPRFANERVLTKTANEATVETGEFYADSEREIDRHSGQLGGIELLRVLHDRMDFEASLES